MKTKPKPSVEVRRFVAMSQRHHAKLLKWSREDRRSVRTIAEMAIDALEEKRRAKP